MSFFEDPSQKDPAVDETPGLDSQDDSTSPGASGSPADDDYDLDLYLQDIPEEYHKQARDVARRVERKVYGKQGERIRTLQEQNQQLQNRLQHPPQATQNQAPAPKPQLDEADQKIRDDLEAIYPELKDLPSTRQNVDQVRAQVYQTQLAAAESILQAEMANGRAQYGKYFQPYQKLLETTVRGRNYNVDQTVVDLVHEVKAQIQSKIASDKAARKNAILASQGSGMGTGGNSDVAVMDDYGGEKTFNWEKTHKKAGNQRLKEEG